MAVRVKPGASRSRLGGCYHGPYGPALVVAVSAPAVDGRATEAVRRALATALGVRPAAVALRRGATSRDKLFAVAVPAAGRASSTGGLTRPGAVADRLRALRDGGMQ